jgi:short-subunit dehydrogenase
VAVEGEEGQVQVNVLALVRLTHAAIGPMVERGHGTVLNVSSIAGEQSVPQNATYGATKAFVTTFSQSVHEEAKGYGVGVTALLPGWTRTEFQERAGYADARKLPAFVWMEADAVAEEALDAAAAGRAVIVPGLGNKVVTAAADVVPKGIKRRAVALLAGRF